MAGTEPQLDPIKLKEVIERSGVDSETAEALTLANNYEEPKRRKKTRGHGSATPPRVAVPKI